MTTNRLNCCVHNQKHVSKKKLHLQQLNNISVIKRNLHVQQNKNVICVIVDIEDLKLLLIYQTTHDTHKLYESKFFLKLGGKNVEIEENLHNREII